MAGFQVGRVGTSALSMDPKILLGMLQARQEENQMRQMQAAQQADAMQKQAQFQRVLGMLSPKERVDAQMFGLEYVADKRKRDEERTYDERVRQDTLRRSEAAVKERYAKEQAEEEAKRKGTLNEAQAVLGKIGAGRLAGRVEGMDESRVQSPEEQAMRSVGMLGMLAPGGTQAAQAMAQAKAQEELQRYKIIEPWEENILMDAAKTAGVEYKPPVGTISRTDFNEAQMMDQQNKKAQDALKQKAEEKRMEEERKKLILETPGWTAEEQQLGLLRLENGFTPQQIKAEVEARRKAAKAEQDKGSGKQDDVQTEIFNLRMKHEEIAAKLSDPEVKGKQALQAQANLINERIKALEGKSKSPSSSPKQGGDRLSELDAKLASGADLTPEEYAEWKSLGGDQ